MRAVAERLGGRGPAAAERDRILAAFRIRGISLGIAEHEGAAKYVGAVRADFDLDISTRSISYRSAAATAIPKGKGWQRGLVSPMRRETPTRR